jgi:hypothetical protein
MACWPRDSLLNAASFTAAWVIPASGLVNGVGEDGGQHLHAIFHPAAGPGQVNDEDIARQARQAAGQHGRRDAGRDTGGPDRF